MYEMKSATMSGLANDTSGGNVDYAAMLAALMAVPAACKARAASIAGKLTSGGTLTAEDQAFIAAIQQGDLSVCDTPASSGSSSGLPWWAWLLIIGGGTKVLGVW